MNIKITKKRFLLYHNYKIKCAVGKKGIANNKIEGDLSTPKGAFSLDCLYYRRDKNRHIKCNIKKKIIKKNMGWCNDPRSKKYNCQINLPSKFTAEKLFRNDRIYDLLININYNKRPTVKNKGSAIFLHLSDKKFKPTAGCIAILKKDFLKILPLINSKTKIIIT